MHNLLKQMIDLRRDKTPGQVVIQLTDQCNASCPQCGMRAQSGLMRSKLPAELVRLTLQAAARREVAAVSFTGGEPLLNLDELAAYIRLAGDLGIKYIRTGTNGFFFAQGREGNRDRVERVADTLADTPLRNLWISIDSALPEVHERMRGFRGVVDGIAKGLPEFHSRGIYPAANMGINRNLGGEDTAGLKSTDFPSRHQYLEAFHHAYSLAFADFFNLVIGLGFTMVNMCYPMSIGGEETSSGLDAVYAATAEEDVVRFASDEKAMIFKALLGVIPRFRKEIRLFSPRSSLYALFRHYSGREEVAYPCRGGRDYFFVDCRNGKAYPCGYRGAEPLGYLWEVRAGRPSAKNSCRLCDWECFRDPSQLMGPLLDIFKKPVQLLRQASRERHASRLWLGDLLYYRECGFFNGRKT